MIKKDLEIYRRSTKQYEFLFSCRGVQMNITNWSIYFTTKTNMSDTDANAKIKKTVTVHPNPLEGKALVILSVDDTDIPKGNYWYSFDYKDDEGNEGILVSGKLKITEPVLDTRT